jgi:hypothetical protein
MVIITDEACVRSTRQLGVGLKGADALVHGKNVEERLATFSS